MADLRPSLQWKEPKKGPDHDSLTAKITNGSGKMKVTIDDVKKIYEDVLSKKISREEAGRWSYSLMQHVENNELQFIPPQEENKIWDLIMYLYGVDNQISPSQYVLSENDILAKFKDGFRNE